MVRNFQETLGRSNDKSEIVLEKMGKRKLSGRRRGGAWPGLAPPTPNKGQQVWSGTCSHGPGGPSCAGVSKVSGLPLGRDAAICCNNRGEGIIRTSS